MKVSIIGSGNVATHLTSVLFDKGIEIVQVFSRNIENAKLLADKVDAESISDLSLLRSDSELYIISVSDSAIKFVVEEMPSVDGIVVHTAGSVGVDVLQKFKSNGVFYPFQTFTKEKNVDFDLIPIFLEANNVENLNLLRKLAKSLSSNVIDADSFQRKNIHLAAVFASNFANHLYSIADNLLSLNNISFDILKPLIKETTEKVMNIHPIQAQTGPAQREDINVINEHLKILDDKNSEYIIYKMLTDSIITYKNKIEK